MMKKNKPEQSGFNEILLYNTPNGGVKTELCLQYAHLFQRISKTVIDTK